jgi:hypothetical protein
MIATPSELGNYLLADSTAATTRVELASARVPPWPASDRPRSR